MGGPEATGIVRRVSTERIEADLWRMVCTPSPTRREREAAVLFAELLAACGAEVELDEAIPASPSVIGRLRGDGPGPTIQLAGHIDHIDVPHAAPARSAGIVSGRGSADMKAGLSCILEIVRLLAARPRRFDGELLVTVYGLHEAPLGHAEGLTRLIEQGVVGDAALVMEGPPEGAVVCGKGQSIWTLTLEREGAACHELRRPGSADDLLDAALMAARALRAENGRLAGIRHELLGAESLFIGQIHFGDFYNRSPAACTLQGTRRWHPDRRFEEVQTQLERLLDSAGLAGGIRKRIEWTFVGESYAVDPQEPIVRAFREAARELRGAEPALAGVSSVLDTSRLVPLGRVPAVPIDCDGATGHADSEFVRMPSVRDACALALATVLRYLSDPAERRP